MANKSGSFFEEHVEKVVLAGVGLLCIWLIVTRVLISPNKVPSGNQKFSPGSIDNHISQLAKDLEHKLSLEPEPKPAYKPQAGEFAARIESAVNVDTNLAFDLPIPTSTNQVGNRKYAAPTVGRVSEVVAEHIRAVAYLPVSDVDGENAYDQARSEPNDIDFVTVEAKYDVASLYRSFHESFAGVDVPEEWRDPCFAKPVFAAVQLQRQELLFDGGWTDWQNVPRSRIDPRKKMFEIVEDVEKLPPGGVKVRMLQFEQPQVFVDLLQPEAYRIASAEEEWFPPSVHRKYVKFQKKVEAQEKRDAKEEEKKEKERKRDEALRDRERGRPTDRQGGLLEDREGGRLADRPRGRYGDRETSRFSERTIRDRESRTRDRSAGGPGRMRLPGRAEREERMEDTSTRGKDASKTGSINEFYDELQGILITDRTVISEVREPLVFWAHDDTVEPGKSYRYRIRLGVLNPIAGTDQFTGADKSLEIKVILWSRFSDLSETIDVPERLYFFPLNIQEAARIVTVKVCKYVLGYWYGDNFTVQQGEVIGKVRENKNSKETKESKGETLQAKQDITVPQSIDYTTGAVLMDVATVNDWSAGGGREPQPRYYPDMLYSLDGSTIEHMPIKMNYWPKELQVKFTEIKKAEEKPKKPWRPWGSKAAQRGIRAGRGGEGTDREDRERRMEERERRMWE
ncbi:MAG TPA: hypothetical protein VMW16_02970 [Sedimentisphaerales bacterium]|nr:hypothetical protein [Sedimentisphaerales bacterium]